MTPSTNSTTDPQPSADFQRPGARHVADLLTNMRASMAHHELVEGRQLTPLMAYLSAWQSLRLARTHADMLNDPEFSQACRFFLDDIYAPRDFSQRNFDGQRIYDFMNRFLPEATLTPLAMALELNLLTQQLDLALAEIMRASLGVTERFDQRHYDAAYLLCNNYAVRSRQIGLIVEVGRHLDRVRRLPLVSTTLRLARRPATRLGWDEMHVFLESGFMALKSLRRLDLFLERIEQRERAILNRIYGLPGGAPADNPFLVSDGGAPEIVL